MRLKYGKGNVDIDLPDKHILGVLPAETVPARPVRDLLKASVMRPHGKGILSTVVRRKRPGDVVIIVSDQTRTIANYPQILEFLAAELIDAGVDEKNIEFLVACGTHQPHDQAVNEKKYLDIARKFKVTSHDCHGEATRVGKTSTGLEVLINRRACQADFAIATGKINFHYLPGFSGGPKAVLPGIAAYPTIRGNHSKLRRPGVRFGGLTNNIISREMSEAAGLFGLDYVVNMTENINGETVNIFWGDPDSAFKAGVAEFLEQRSKIVTEAADCCIVSAGGYPADRDLFFGHKAISSCLGILKPRGAIILTAQCADGFGDEKFYHYLYDNSLDELLACPEDNIQVGGHRAFVTAGILKRHEIIVYSDLDQSALKRLGFSSISNLKEIHSLLTRRFGDEYRVYFVPNGRTVLPRLASQLTKALV